MVGDVKRVVSGDTVGLSVGAAERITLRNGRALNLASPEATTERRATEWPAILADAETIMTRAGAETETMGWLPRLRRT